MIAEDLTRNYAEVRTSNTTPESAFGRGRGKRLEHSSDATAKRLGNWDELGLLAYLQLYWLHCCANVRVDLNPSSPNDHLREKKPYFRDTFADPSLRRFRCPCSRPETHSIFENQKATDFAKPFPAYLNPQHPHLQTKASSPKTLSLDLHMPKANSEPGKALQL